MYQWLLSLKFRSPRRLLVEAISEKFDALVCRVRDCTACKRMKDSQRVLGPSAGSLRAPIMFIGEAPGRLGADSSGIPFHGDKAGHNFEQLLRQVGISRYAAFVTNAVLCNPRDEAGNNSTPSSQEVENCSAHLREQIDLVSPRIVVSLGATALRATSLIEQHQFSLQKHVRTAQRWYGRILIPAYHPGQRAMVHRSFANQLSDYQFIAETLNRLDKNKRKMSTSLRADTYEIVDFITRTIPAMSYFKLHKIFYLAEYAAAKELGERLTTAYIVRQKDGPYCTDLHIAKLKKAFPDLQIQTRTNGLFLSRSRMGLFDSLGGTLHKQAIEILDGVIKKYASYDDAQLKTAVYLTVPMRRILRAEKSLRKNFFNVPIEFT